MFNINQSMTRIVTIASIIGITYGCAATTQIVDTSTDNAPTMQALDYRDFDSAANEAISSLINTGVLDHPQGGRYVLNIDRVVNDTTQRIDTDDIVRKMRVSLLNSGKVVVQTVSITQGAEDKSVIQSRDLDKSKLFNQSKKYGNNKLVKPDYSLSGKIKQKTLYMDNGNKQIEYSFILVLTNLENGLAYWEMDKKIIKRSSSRASSW